MAKCPASSTGVPGRTTPKLRGRSFLDDFPPLRPRDDTEGLDRAERRRSGLDAAQAGRSGRVRAHGTAARRLLTQLTSSRSSASTTSVQATSISWLQPSSTRPTISARRTRPTSDNRLTDRSVWRSRPRCTARSSTPDASVVIGRRAVDVEHLALHERRHGGPVDGDAGAALGSHGGSARTFCADHAGHRVAAQPRPPEGLLHRTQVIRRRRRERGLRRWRGHAHALRPAVPALPAGLPVSDIAVRFELSVAFTNYRIDRAGLRKMYEKRMRA